jgi:hypothetical protein
MGLFESFKNKSEEEVNTIKEAEKLVDMEKSGNPDQKYQSGSIRQFAKEAEKDGEYKPYIEDVIKTTEERLPEFEEQIKKGEKAFSKLDDNKTIGTTKDILKEHLREQEQAEINKMKSEIENGNAA